MPIRFRCEYCQQLLGIARRKAGTYVNCPTCRRQVLVPAEDQSAAEAPLPAPVPVPAPAPAGAPLFERDDFEDLLRPPPSLAGQAPARYQTPPPPRADHGPRAADLQPGESAGVLLSPARATALTVMVILLLAVSFGAGLLVGRFYL